MTEDLRYDDGRPWVRFRKALGVIAEGLGLIAEGLGLIRGRCEEEVRWDYRWCECAIRQDRDY